ncbi:hypothetical protein N7526_010319 [Penicillium atrosanguineum]|nr:hypothetical protein N7526_010319 [Penicillium atrosanguineum]
MFRLSFDHIPDYVLELELAFDHFGQKHSDCRSDVHCDGANHLHGNIDELWTTSTPPVVPTSGTTKSTNTGAIIGEILGGLAGLTICAALIWICLRRKQQAKLDIRLLSSSSAQSPHGREISSIRAITHLPRKFNTQRWNADHKIVSLIPRLPDIDNISDSVVSPPLTRGTGGTGASHTNTTISSISSSRPSLSLHGPSIGPSERSAFTAGISSISSRSTSQIPQMPLTPRIQPHTFLFPKLYDTPVNCSRAELAPYSCSELIKIPLEQRSRNLRPHGQLPKLNSKPTDPPLPSVDSISPLELSSPTSMPRETRQRLVTSDSVVLAANLDRYSVPIVLAPKLQEEWSGDPESDHVMRFLKYERGHVVEMAEKERGGDS